MKSTDDNGPDKASIETGRQLEGSPLFDKSGRNGVSPSEMPGEKGKRKSRKRSSKRRKHRFKAPHNQDPVKAAAHPQVAAEPVPSDIAVSTPREPVTTDRPYQKRPAYAALDLGTNNCRLLVAIPNGPSFRVIDAFSRIVRLGEGIGRKNSLSVEAMDRAVEALKVCASKLEERSIRKFRLIATEACRIADNGEVFINRVREETGLDLEVVNRETEARLAVTGCVSLIDRHADGVILFDIGGGSSELVWLDFKSKRFQPNDISKNIRSWMSLPVGVVNVSERHGGVNVTPDSFEAMVEDVMRRLDDFPEKDALTKMVQEGRVHMLGTSGTVTTLAGIYLGLERYNRRRVDGLWLRDTDVSAMTDKLLAMSFEERRANACIGAERADLVLAGCAILEAVRRKWPCERLRVADRGLREGILYELMVEDGVLRSPPRKNRHLRRGRARRPQDRGSEPAKPSFNSSDR